MKEKQFELIVVTASTDARCHKEENHWKELNSTMFDSKYVAFLSVIVESMAITDQLLTALFNLSSSSSTSSLSVAVPLPSS